MENLKVEQQDNEYTVTHIGFHSGPEVGANDNLIHVRVIPIERDGNKVIGRTLNHGEPDNGNAIIVQQGDILIFPVGNVVFFIQDIDRHNSPAPSGYAPLSNTVWTWLEPSLPQSNNIEFFRFLLAASRRIDTAHDLCVALVNELESSPQKHFIKMRGHWFKALGYAESMFIALNRAIRMIKKVPSEFSISEPIPKKIDTIFPALKNIRDALEHIDERVFGIINSRGQKHDDALTIFDNDNFYSSGVFCYADYSLDIMADVIPALVDSRQFLLQAVIEKTGGKITLNRPVIWDFRSLSGENMPIILP